MARPTQYSGATDNANREQKNRLNIVIFPDAAFAASRVKPSLQQQCPPNTFKILISASHTRGIQGHQQSITMLTLGKTGPGTAFRDAR